jgi:transcription elongation GreA/GreB family factor
MASLDKAKLRDELLAKLRADLHLLERAQDDAQQGATHEEAKAEDDKDTRAIEASYLARGHATRVEELARGIVEVEHMTLRVFGDDAPAALSAVVTVAEEKDELKYFIAPHGGGTALAKGKVQVVTPKSPLGRTLLGKHEGDEVEVRVGTNVRALEIESVE